MCYLCHSFLKAVLATTNEFNQVTIYLKAGFPGYPSRHLGKVAISKVHYLPRTRAYQVMVVF